MAPFRPNRRVVWKKRLEPSQNGWPDAAYADPVEIPARVTLKARTIAGVGTGNELQAINNTVVDAPVDIGDLLNITDTSEENYEEVEARESVEDVSGRILRYVCYFEPVRRSGSR